MYQRTDLQTYIQVFMKTAKFPRAHARAWKLTCCTNVKTRTLLHIGKQAVTRLLSRRYHNVFPLLVTSCCDKSGASYYHLVIRLMTVTELPHVVPTKGRSQQFAMSLFCDESVGLIILVTR
jgi:hypothetical protein